MNTPPLVHAIAIRLREAGYRDIATPFRIATVEFEFTMALRGIDGRALDLVLLIDTTTGEFGDRDAARVRQRVEALSRALDVTGSRFVVTVILAGAALAGDIDSLTETCRVLHVETLPLSVSGSPVDEVAYNQLEDRIRVLLPLELPDPPLPSVGEGGNVVELLMQALPKGMNRTLLNVVVTASQQGEESVTQALSQVLGEALQIKEVE
jgi:hypothetical protein